MRVFVQFENSGDIIDCPPKIVPNLPDLREQFLTWMYNEKNNHSYWVYQNGKKAGCAYRGDAFVEWLNTYILKYAEPCGLFLQTEVEQAPADCPVLYLL